MGTLKFICWGTHTLSPVLLDRDHDTTSGMSLSSKYSHNEPFFFCVPASVCAGRSCPLHLDVPSREAMTVNVGLRLFNTHFPDALQKLEGALDGLVKALPGKAGAMPGVRWRGTGQAAWFWRLLPIDI